MNNGGDGTISSPVSFPPPNENCNFYFDFLDLFFSFFFSFYQPINPTLLIILFYFLFCFSDYTSLQLFLSCGEEVTIYSARVGYRDNGPPVSALPMSTDFTVNSWTNNLEDDVLEAQVYSSKQNNHDDTTRI